MLPGGSRTACMIYVAFFFSWVGSVLTYTDPVSHLIKAYYTDPASHLIKAYYTDPASHLV